MNKILIAMMAVYFLIMILILNTHIEHKFSYSLALTAIYCLFSITYMLFIRRSQKALGNVKVSYASIFVGAAGVALVLASAMIIFLNI